MHERMQNAHAHVDDVIHSSAYGSNMPGYTEMGKKTGLLTARFKLLKNYITGMCPLHLLCKYFMTNERHSMYLLDYAFIE